MSYSRKLSLSVKIGEVDYKQVFNVNYSGREQNENILMAPAKVATIESDGDDGFRAVFEDENVLGESALCDLRWGDGKIRLHALLTVTVDPNKYAITGGAGDTIVAVPDDGAIVSKCYIVEFPANFDDLAIIGMKVKPTAEPCYVRVGTYEEGTFTSAAGGMFNSGNVGDTMVGTPSLNSLLGGNGNTHLAVAHADLTQSVRFFIDMGFTE